MSDNHTIITFQSQPAFNSLLTSWTIYVHPTNKEIKEF